VRPELEANTLSALRYPAGVDASLVGRVIAKGVVVAGGLHPAIKDQYFRVGHMGYSATQPEHLDRALKAIEDALGARQ
jgi:alanine-glyoxylate transaminase/serine-glyoxylate transaminase/serine-pyruvate transaminase